MGSVYHDNPLFIFSHHERLSIGRAQFTIETSSVTDDQDPEGRLAPGKHIKIENHERDGGRIAEPALNFSAGRTQSESVATFWNSGLKSHETTFSDKLPMHCFAVIGSLEIQGYIDDRAKTFIIPDIGFTLVSAKSDLAWKIGIKGANLRAAWTIQLPIEIDGTSYKVDIKYKPGGSINLMLT